MIYWEGWEWYFGTLKNPNALAVLPTRLVPPTQPDESTPSDILAVVEIGREEEDHDNEDQNTIDSVPTVSTRRLLAGFGEGDVQVGREPEAEEVSQQRSFTPLTISMQARQLVGERVRGCTQAESEKETQRGRVRGQAPA